MRILIAAVGRARGGPEAALYDHYANRITAWQLSLREIDLRRKLTGAALIEAEGAALLTALPDGAACVVLDRRGKPMASTALAHRLRDWQDDGVRDVALVIGGADGHGEAVLSRADVTVSLGPMTWPHLLVRGMLAEQLYRAQQILAGHPYHRA